MSRRCKSKYVVADADAYHRLVVAVIVQAVNDVQHGPLLERHRARADIATGCLDRWVELASDGPHAYGRIQDLLRELFAS